MQEQETLLFYKVQMWKDCGLSRNFLLRRGALWLLRLTKCTNLTETFHKFSKSWMVVFLAPSLTLLLQDALILVPLWVEWGLSSKRSWPRTNVWMRLISWSGVISLMGEAASVRADLWLLQWYFASYMAWRFPCLSPRVW